MALRYLISWDDPLFHKRCRPVENFDEWLWMLLDDMRETLEKVGGYAAPLFMSAFCGERLL